MARTQTRQDEQQKTERRLPDDELKRALYLLKLCRYFDERMEALYRQGARLSRPGNWPSDRGPEYYRADSLAASAFGLRHVRLALPRRGFAGPHDASQRHSATRRLAATSSP